MEGFEGKHGMLGFGERNIEGGRLLEFESSFDLAATNSFFDKQSHLVTFHSGYKQISR